MPDAPAHPFENARYLGTVSRVSPLGVQVNLPFATEAAPAQYAGSRVTRGQVGEFVVIETFASVAIIGRITEIRLPERDRLSVEPERDEGETQANPIGVIRLLGSVDLEAVRSSRGISDVPRIGDYVYLAHPDFIRLAIVATKAGKDTVALGHLSGAPESKVALPLSSIFGRHCAILGSTGGGKSWSTMKLIEAIAGHGGKAIVIDPTGEYQTLGDHADHVFLGGQRKGEADTRRFVSFPHHHLGEMDLFAIVQPSPGVQAPKLREAIASLKLLALKPELADDDGFLVKEGKVKKPINQAFLENDDRIRAPSAKFDVSKLSQQILKECVQLNAYAQGSPDYRRWGAVHEVSVSSCITLCMRVENNVNSQTLSAVFKPADYMEDLTEVIHAFAADANKRILRVSMEYLSFENSTRELVVNAIGRFLLTNARDDKYQAVPLVVVLDEAHQFLSKSVGDENNRVFLDAFGLVAKEGRKYGLTCVLATQRPRDIPEDVLSQVGMFVVHRLINERDQAVVVNASGVLDGSSAAFLPNLRDGEALLIGTNSIMPLPVTMAPPLRPPKLSANVDTTWLT
ncbi:ATP-binding protein [Rhizobium leguminosarum]|uniref:ATP-binding protein n=1 Tax=Rhizobium leguminosarum TaxID=384 RepID=UPI0010408D07|nr:ATP-binding protein [Rhizobium leguminosarum]TBZ79686.1 ATP-binding protein [Rhizobium leguminosarum bv. viciae]TBZ97048.1 ATP-binding protein [Rhizobium leguminosarum bv. viciae]